MRGPLYVGYNVNIKCAHFQVFVRRVEAESSTTECILDDGAGRCRSNSIGL